VRARGTKVCLTGEGSDESFAGYQYFKLEALWRQMLAGGAAAEEAQALFAQFRTLEARTEGIMWEAGERWRRAEHPYGYPSLLQTRIDGADWMARWMFQWGRLGLGRANLPSVMLRRLFPPDELGQLTPMNAARSMAFAALAGYIIPALGDRVEMANSVECRTPFLDRALLDFACRLPPERLIDLPRLREKRIVHEAFADLLPPVVKRGHKHPLLSPSWRRFAATGVGRALVEEQLAPAAVARAGLFRPSFVRAALALWRRAPTTSLIGKQLDVGIGALLTTQLLHDRFVTRRAWTMRPLTLVRRQAAQREAA
jgi:asparagine synthase (glutamine-hydrolysing)